MRYAIISDIHGNLSALTAVLDDIKKQNIDRVVCLGDIIGKGANGHECVRLVREKCNAVVRGNNDVRYSKSLDEIAGSPEFDYEYFLWTQKQLTADDIAYIRNLPMCCEFVLSGRLVRGFHATPNNVDSAIFNFDGYKTKLNLFYPTEFTTEQKADVVVYGHTHSSGMENLFGYTLINVGSVGCELNIIDDSELNNPKISDLTMAQYVILSGVDGRDFGEIGIEFRKVKYDKIKELDNYSYLSKKGDYADEIIFGKFRNREKIKWHLHKNGITEW